jgi:hypothetical protein
MQPLLLLPTAPELLGARLAARGARLGPLLLAAPKIDGTWLAICRARLLLLLLPLLLPPVPQLLAAAPALSAEPAKLPLMKLLLGLERHRLAPAAGLRGCAAWDATDSAFHSHNSTVWVSYAQVTKGLCSSGAIGCALGR